MTVERYPRSARRYHAAIYVVTLLLLATGWWLLAGREGNPSPIARLTGIPDARLHVWLGWALVVAALVPLPFATRGVVTFFRETIRYDRGDFRWLIRLPGAMLTGRFRRHEGHFDPGQRIANLAIVGLLIALVVTGVALVLIEAGPLFAVMAFVHRVATIAFSVVIVGHIIVATGILPGYRGVWRSMHLGGRVPLATARRLWPGWLERQARLPGRLVDRRPAMPPSSARPAMTASPHFEAERPPDPTRPHGDDHGSSPARAGAPGPGLGQKMMPSSHRQSRGRRRAGGTAQERA